MGEYTDVRYLGSVKILKSLIEFQSDQREIIVSKAILKLFNETDLEIRPQLNEMLMNEIDRVPHDYIDAILGSVIVSEKPRTPSTVTMTPERVSITIPMHNSVGDGRMFESARLVAQHQMDVISFASLDMSVYVSYVAKQSGPNQASLESTRACHVIQCVDQRQANDMYKSFATAFNQNRRTPIQPMTVDDPFNAGKSRWDPTLPRNNQTAGASDFSSHSYCNTDPSKTPPPGGLRDLREPCDRTYVNDKVVDEIKKKSQISVPEVKSTPVYVNDPPPPPPNDPNEALKRLVEEAKRLNFFHNVNRVGAETILVDEGDFIIRESSLDLVRERQIKNICLSVRNNSQFKHLVLIERPLSAESGKVHTRDRLFSSIAQLIEYFQQEGRHLEMPGEQAESIKIVRPILRASAI